MRLSRLYSNKPELFIPVDFRPGLNVVLAEIRLPQNRKRDTHNLGKTTLGRLVDFCLLSKRDPRAFPFKQVGILGDFDFYLEIELFDASFLTIRRSVREQSRISLKHHETGGQDYTGIPDAVWDHFDVAFERARDLIDAILDLSIMKPWQFRKGLGYLIRSQEDYLDVFQLGRFQSGAHSEWKPYVAQVLGFRGDLASDLYTKDDALQEKEAVASTVRAELGGSIADVSKIEGLLQLKRKEADQKARYISSFDFRSDDKKQTKELVDTLDEDIARLNRERYALSQSRRRITSALEEDEIIFSAGDAQSLFKEAGVIFPDQLKRDFDQLVGFNRAITEERRGYLREELSEIDQQLKDINTRLNEMGKKRSQVLAYLSERDVFAKYKEASDELVSIRADILGLERQRGYLHRLQDLRSEIRVLQEQKVHLQVELEANVESQNQDGDSFFSKLRQYFSEIIEEVLERKALLSVAPNQLGNLEFRAEILDDSGNSTSADLGHTYKKLLCIAFDMAVLRAHSEGSFPRFVFHDGALESLDDRKKLNLIDVMRRYSAYGIQQIITAIDSDLPTLGVGRQDVFSPEEIVLTLHDEGESGRLFRMRSW
jgi:uncharacterized protein YydD (DUF2326 family)